MPRIAPCLRFGSEAEDAAGWRFLALNGGAPAGHTHAASFHVDRAG